MEELGGLGAYGLNICAAETSYAAIRERLTASTTAA